MNEQIQRALEDMARRGKDPGATSVVQRAFEAAPKLRRSKRIQRGAAGAVAVLVLAGTAVAVGARSSGPHQVVVATPTTKSISPSDSSTFSLAPALRQCFSLPQPSGTEASAPSVEAGTNLSSRLLVLTNAGALWVIDGGKATIWSAGSDRAEYSAIVWARWLADGSILAARAGHADVELDEFSAAGRFVPVAHLAYTIKAAAPRGSCPINGYLATFAVVDAGVVLLPHQAGPWGHSCPPRSAPSACVSPESYSIEVRDASHLATVGRGTGDTAGGAGIGHTRLVSASRATDTIVIDEGSDGMAMRVGPSHFCCLGGQSGTAYAASPDGQKIAYAIKPGGRDVLVGSLDPTSDADKRGASLWISPDTISAMAWTGETLAVAHGSRLTFVAVPAGTVLGEANFNTDIRTIDFQSQG